MATNTNSMDSLDTLEPDRWLHLVRRHVDSLRYGIVQIVVHDSRVVQLEFTERIRLDRPDDALPAKPELKVHQTADGDKPKHR